jgi:hypothetical protein
MTSGDRLASWLSLCLLVALAFSVELVGTLRVLQTRTGYGSFTHLTGGWVAKTRHLTSNRSTVCEMVRISVMTEHQLTGVCRPLISDHTAVPASRQCQDKQTKAKRLPKFS